jgi:TPR repeat protein
MPGEATINTLLRELRRGLDEAGFAWLVSFAVYPELRWPLTLQLGWTLKDAHGRPSFDAVVLLLLSRLPWLRSGYMPEWLRSRLLAELGDEEKLSLRRAFDAAFAEFKRSKRFQLYILRRGPGDRGQRRRDGVCVDFIRRTQARRRFAEVLPAENFMRLIHARPFRQLIGTLILGSIVAAALMVALLAFLPINECDLLASNSADPRRVGSGVAFTGLQLRPAALSACERAVGADPKNARFLYQYARAIEAAKGDRASQPLYEEAAALGHPMAINSLLNISRIHGDFSKANKYLAELEHIEPSIGKYQRGLFYANGWGVTRDAETAFALLSSAAKDGGPGAATAAKLILDGRITGHSIEEGTDLLQFGAEAGDFESASILGFAFGEGQYNLEKSLRKSHSMYMKAAAQGDMDALNNAARDFEVGIILEVDLGKAATLYLQSAHVGNVVAIGNLVNLLERNQGLLPDLRPMIPRLTEYAAGRNDPDAQLRIAAASEKDDPDKAILWYKTVLGNDKAHETQKDDARKGLARLTPSAGMP